MKRTHTIPPICAKDIAPQIKKSNYPEPYASQMQGREKRKLGDHFGLTNFGVNLTELQSGAVSALFHKHTKQDEFVYVLSGTGQVRMGKKLFNISAGDVIGFKANSGTGHQIINSGNELLVFIEVGDRTSNDRVDYPNDDLCASLNEDGHWFFTNKKGEPYAQ
uniref:cupin domain-containing protein n=1 Tax=Ningiella ruwaisensis TaxID=2364274 RepID=UPI0010A00E03|nr:cupin domain-containing protein [Ningiella ruwaisensis]